MPREAGADSSLFFGGAVGVRRVYIDGGSTHCTNVAKYLQKRRESNLLQQGDYKKKKKKQSIARE
jgi:hypothetical protein